MIKIKHLHKNTTRFFTQHDHGILSGEIAHRFIDPTRGERLSMPLVCAITTHDLGWDRADDFGHHEPETIPFSEGHGVHDFLHLAYAHKLPLYLEGIERCEAIHPYAGLLISLHYTAFLDSKKYAEIMHQERARRTRLAEQLGYADARDPRILDDYERLKFFDLISLFVCMRAPDHDDSACPAWISPQMTLLGRDYDVGFRDALTLQIDPFPFAKEFEVTLPYRDLPNEALDDPASFVEAWRKARLQTWQFWIRRVDQDEDS